MKKQLTTLAALLIGTWMSGANATSFDMAEWATNLDGDTSDHVLDPNTPFTGWTWTFNFATVGAHKARLFVDPEIDQVINTWFYEFGSTGGTQALGQSWEIDEPGNVYGDILDNVFAGILDNSNGVPETALDDVSMALGWDFSLATGETAVAKFFLSQVAPTSGFYLSQTDPDSNATVYFYSTLTVTSCTERACNPVPEPSTAWLLGPALLGLLASRRKFSKTA
jgi:hypothetical protein